MITVAQARERIVRHVTPLEPESVPLAAAHERILREPLVAPEDMPSFDRSAMDGYAIRGDETAEDLEVVGEIPAGQSIDRSLRPGEAFRIFTGARLPAPNLGVVMQEHVEVRGPRIHLLKPGHRSHVRRRGEDARAGDVLLEPGASLQAIGLALLASVGQTSVLVSRRPRILHLTTGDEIVPPEQIPSPGQIRNSNASLVSALCREQGAEAVTHLHACDDLPEMIDLLSRAAAGTHDVILISGGSGPGAYDFSAELFRHLGATIHFREVGVRPGKPIIFGASGSRVVFGLPGNVLSHYVCFHLFVRLALDRLLARPDTQPVYGVLAEAMSETQNTRETWWPARAALREGRLELRALSWKSSGDITRVAGANALLRVPASTPQLTAGTMVETLLTQSHPSS